MEPEGLEEALQVVTDTAQSLGVPVGDSVKALIDAGSVSISGGGVALHDDGGIPLACSIAGAKSQGGILVAVGNPQWGIGSRIPPSRR